MGREAMEGGCNGNNFDAEFAKGAKFRRGRTGNGNNLNAEGAEVSRRAQNKRKQGVARFAYATAAAGGRRREAALEARLGSMPM